MEKRRKKSLWMGVGIVVAVVICAGVGFSMWHNQPTFCNAICHKPMDVYVDGFYNDTSLLAHTHQKSHVNCLDCHVPTLDEQIGEAVSWVKDDYEVLEDGHLKTVGVTADTKMCFSSGCHTNDEIIEATKNWGGVEGVNPHQSHQGEAIDCSNCHGVHTTSAMYCNTCHDYKVPEGWINPATPEVTPVNGQAK